MPTKSPTFGEFVREKRTQKGLSLRGFAELVGLSPTYISQIETNAESPPTADRARKMAEVLGEPEDVLIVMAGRIPDDLPGIIQKRPAEMANFIREAGDLSTEQLASLTEQARRLKKRGRRPPK